jgi:hypothetical protein
MQPLFAPLNKGLNKAPCLTIRELTFATGFLLMMRLVALILVNGIALLHYLTKPTRGPG